MGGLNLFSQFSMFNLALHAGFFTNTQHWHYCQLCIAFSFFICNIWCYDISGSNKWTFQGGRLHWSSSFLVAHLKRNWQYWKVWEKPYGLSLILSKIIFWICKFLGKNARLYAYNLNRIMAIPHRDTAQYGMWYK